MLSKTMQCAVKFRDMYIYSAKENYVQLDLTPYSVQTESDQSQITALYLVTIGNSFLEFTNRSEQKYTRRD